jgi:hypothetical protein
MIIFQIREMMCKAMIHFSLRLNFWCEVIILFYLICQFSPGTPYPVFSTNKTYRHDITEILLKLALNNITLAL